MSGLAVSDVVMRLLAVYEEVAAADIGLLDTDELFAFVDGIETVARQLPSQSQRGLARLDTETTPRELGAKTWNEVLRTRWRLSSGEAGRRLAEMRDLAPRQQVTGPTLPPLMPAIAAAQDGGLITAEQVRFLRDTLNNDLPAWVDAITRSQVEVELVRVAVGQGYDALRRVTKTRLTLLDQDGPDPEAVERERRRKRGARKGQQGPDGLTSLTVTMDPETAAMAEVLFAKFAAPGMCNPDDEQPCYYGTPSQAQIDNDHRTLAQRQHDALKVVWRIALMTDLGKLNGLPVSIIIRTTLQDLETRGIAISGGGTVMTMDDVDRLGGHAAYHLCVFDGKTGSALNHFRSKRVATAAQRVMLIAQHGVGCTKPGCTVDAYGVQAHHAVKDWADNCNTNVDELAPACSGDNNLVGKNGYTTRMNERGECEWIPPEHLDTGQDRTNILHRPEALTAPNDEPETDAADTYDTYDTDEAVSAATHSVVDTGDADDIDASDDEEPFFKFWVHPDPATTGVAPDTIYETESFCIWAHPEPEATPEQDAGDGTPVAEPFFTLWVHDTTEPQPEGVDERDTVLHAGASSQTEGTATGVPNTTTDDAETVVPWVNDHTDRPAPTNPIPEAQPFNPWADDHEPFGEAADESDSSETVLDNDAAAETPAVIAHPDEPIPYVLTDNADDDAEPFDPSTDADVGGPAPPDSHAA